MQPTAQPCVALKKKEKAPTGERKTERRAGVIPTGAFLQAEGGACPELKGEGI